MCRGETNGWEQEAGRWEFIQWKKKKNPFLIFCLFIYFFVVVANWLSVAASSAWMPPPLRKIKGGQGGGRSLGGGGSGGVAHVGRQAEQNQSNAQWAWYTIHYTCPRHLHQHLPPIWLSLAPRHDIHCSDVCSVDLHSTFLKAVFTLLLLHPVIFYTLHASWTTDYVMHCTVAAGR